MPTLDFCRGTEDYYVPLRDVLDGEIPMEEIRDKIDEIRATRQAQAQAMDALLRLWKRQSEDATIIAHLLEVDASTSGHVIDTWLLQPWASASVARRKDILNRLRQIYISEVLK